MSQTLANVIDATDAVKVDGYDEALQIIAFRRLMRAKARIAEAEEQVKVQTEELWKAFGETTGKHIIPGGVGEITFSDNNVYDAKAMEDALKPGQLRLVTKRVLDRAKVKSMYPAVYEAARSNRGYKSSVKAYQ